MNIGFAAAGALTLGICAVHLFGGGPVIARPLLDSSLDPVAKYTNYYCWHITSITLATMAVGFGYAAAEPGGADVGVVMTGLTLAFAGWRWGSGSANR